MGRVVIRTKKKCHGTMLSVYLEFCPPFTDNCGKQVRYEFLDLEKYTTPAKEYLDEKEIRRLERVEFTEYPDIQRACLLSIYTGLRRSDILALDWKCVHINSKKRSNLDIIIHKTQATVKLPLSPAAIELLGKHKKKRLGVSRFDGL